MNTVHLFPQLDGALVELLKLLTPDEWRAPTIVPGWTVQQVAGHLVDTALRRLTNCRDGWWPATDPPQTDHELVELVNRLNADGVRVYGQLSPSLLIAMTELVTPQLAAHLASLDPMGPACYSVSWAGEESSRHWFDVARELTERWHHQQQIRLATNRPGIMTPRLYGPVLETFMRVLPHAYRRTDARLGTTCDVVVPGECGGRWRVVREDARWVMDVADPGRTIASVTTIPPDLAWRLFTKAAPKDEVRERVRIDGDARLGAVVLDAVAIVG